jgi:replicative DNA helicase
MTEELPHAPIAEKSVLSVMMMDPSCIARAAAEGIDASAFYLPANKLILAAIAAAKNAGETNEDGSVNISCIVQKAHLDGTLASMGGPSEIATVHGYAFSKSGWSSWCDMLRECKARRLAILGAHKLAQAEDGEEAVKSARSTLEAILGAITAKTRAIGAKQACDEFIARYVATYEGGSTPGTSTGILEIDGITGGLKAGELWTVGGPSSSGKSALMYQIAAEYLGESRVVAIFTAELMVHHVIGRIVCQHARVPYSSITNPREVTKMEMGRIQTAIKSMQETRLWIDATGGQSIETIAGEAERIRDIESRIDLIVVDYIQIIRGIRNRGDSREQEIASISGGLKQLAKTMGCAVLTGTQLNDDGKTRESRAIEQDSDVLIIIKDAGLEMRKVRDGPRGEVLSLALDGEAQRFRYFASEQ